MNNPRASFAKSFDNHSCNLNQSRESKATTEL